MRSASSKLSGVLQPRSLSPGGSSLTQTPIGGDDKPRLHSGAEQNDSGEENDTSQEQILLAELACSCRTCPRHVLKRHPFCGIQNCSKLE